MTRPRLLSGFLGRLFLFTFTEATYLAIVCDFYDLHCISWSFVTLRRALFECLTGNVRATRGSRNVSRNVNSDILSPLDSVRGRPLSAFVREVPENVKAAQHSPLIDCVCLPM